MAVAGQDPYPGVALVADSMTVQALRFVWDRIANLTKLVKGPTTGTLNPDQKPTLGIRDVGTKFFATDFNREFIWDGVAWNDSPAAHTRFQLAFFVANPEPPIGWAPCNGSTTPRSTAQGTTILFTLPVIPDYAGQKAYMRL